MKTAVYPSSSIPESCAKLVPRHTESVLVTHNYFTDSEQIHDEFYLKMSENDVCKKEKTLAGDHYTANELYSWTVLSGAKTILARDILITFDQPTFCTTSTNVTNICTFGSIKKEYSNSAMVPAMANHGQVQKCF